MDNKELAMIGALAVVALAAGVFLGYALKEAPQAAANNDTGATYVSMKDHIYTMSANGTTVEMKKCTSFLIALPENGGSTGYLWDITSSQGLDVLESIFVPGSQGLPGEPGIREWVITAARPGEQKFIATLHRPSAALTGSEEVFTFTINVTE